MPSTIGLKLLVILTSIASVSTVGQAQVVNSSRPISEQASATPFKVWDRFPEGKVLNLHPTFSEPSIIFGKAGLEKHKKIQMTVFTIRAKASIKKAANQIKLGRLLDDELFRSLDKKARLEPITAADAMTVSVESGKPVTNFEWCNTSKGENREIQLPSFERSQTHMLRPNQNWCSGDPTRTKCYEVCRMVPEESGLLQAIKGYNLFKRATGSDFRSKDLGMAMQYEARLFNNEKEFNPAVPLSSLTNISTEVTGVIEVTFFYINQIVTFGKILLVIQPDPAQPQNSIITGLNAFAIRTDIWDRKIYGSEVQKLFNGTSNFNMSSGILAGIPKFAQNAVNIFAAASEKM